MRAVCFATHRSSPAPIRALNSLTETQAALIEAGLPNGWILRRHDSYDGQLSLLITRRDAGDDLAYTVDRDGSGVHLGRLRGDACELVGTFPDLRDSLRVLGGMLVDVEDRTTPHAA